MPTRSNLKNRKSAVKVNDWKLVKKQVEADEPIAFDPEVDPYDPNDEAAVEAFWASATITRGRGRPPIAVKRPTLTLISNNLGEFSRVPALQSESWVTPIS